MDYSGIIKRSWQITWRYRALWVLGVFAGVSGCTGGGSGGNSGGGSGSSGSGGGAADFEQLYARAQEYIPLVVGLTVFLFFAGLVWYVFAVAARGGLITGVDSIERGAQPALSELWQSGFSRFWSLVGVDVLLSLPLVIVGLLMAGMIGIPLLSTVLAGNEPSPAIFAPMCGALAIGLPLTLIGSFVLGIMRLVAQRYVMLGGRGTVDSSKDAWRFFRARLKDSAIMWLVNFGLNVASSFVLAIPAVIVGIAVAVPLVSAIATEEWGVLVGAIPVAIVLFGLLGLAYNAIWGTYTSSLWTLFFRAATDVAAPAVAPEYAPVSPYGAPVTPPQAPVVPASPYAPAPQPPQGAEWPPPAPAEPAPPIAPPIAPMPPEGLAGEPPASTDG